MLSYASQTIPEVNVVKRVVCVVLLLVCFAIPVNAAPIRWVDFDVPYESLKFAMDMDIDSYEKENHISWIDILSVAACRTGGKCGLSSVKKASAELLRGESPEEVLGSLFKHYAYYKQAYSAVLGGMLGTYTLDVDDEQITKYGLKAYSPIAAGYGYSHCADFGNARTFGFNRKHLGNDLMGELGTPIVVVEGGVVEALGWNRYGGWRIGIRSFDSQRYYYYAHLRKDRPFADELQIGDVVQPGDLIGFMGRTGYSNEENVNNIESVHLHFGMQLIFDESQKECPAEIWIDVYDIVRLLSEHRSTIVKSEGSWKRKYPFVDMDIFVYPGEKNFV